MCTEPLPPVRTAVIGMGNMGTQYAGKLLAGQVPGMALAAVTRVNPARLAEHGVTLPPALPVYRTADDLFAAVDSGALKLDAVLVVTPQNLHEAHAMAAMRRGLCVLCDKPAGIESAQARRMEQARPQGLVCGYMFQLRAYPVYRRLHALIHSRELGALKRLHWTVTDWYRTDHYYQRTPWRGRWDLDGGGVLLNQCPHNLDMLQWLCGMPRRVRAFCYNGKYHPIEVEDEATVFLEWEGGATGVFVTSTCEAPGVNRLEITLENGLIVCEAGSVRIARLDRPEREVRALPGTGFEHPNAAWQTLPWDSGPDPYAAALRNFAEAVHRRDPDLPLAPWAEGRKSLLLTNAAYLSSWRGETVAIPAPGAADEAAFEQAFARAWRAQCRAAGHEV